MSDTCDHCGGRVGQYSHGCPGCGAPQCCQLCCTGNHEALHAEVERLTAWVDDLQSGMYVNCVYCGHRYGPGETTPVSMSDALKAHVEQCPQHPMSALRAEVERLRAELDEIASVLPGVAYMDPPDGGSPSIAEQVRRMRADLDHTKEDRDELIRAVDTWHDEVKRLRGVLKAEVERLRAALMEILDECKNEGAYCPIVQERMLERIELCAMAAIDAARKETP